MKLGPRRSRAESPCPGTSRSPILSTGLFRIEIRGVFADIVSGCRTRPFSLANRPGNSSGGDPHPLTRAGLTIRAGARADRCRKSQHRHFGAFPVPETGLRGTCQNPVRIYKTKKMDQTSAAVIPSTPDWIMTATAIITPAISRATATLPFLSSSNTSTPLVSLSRMLSAR